VGTYSVFERSRQRRKSPEAVKVSRMPCSIIQEVLLRYMIWVGLVQPEVATVKTSILISNGDLFAELLFLGCFSEVRT